MEPDVGTGDNKVTRWHFNSKTGHCESFIFRGLNGNPNNFLTYDQCVNGCGSRQQVLYLMYIRYHQDVALQVIPAVLVKHCV